MPYVMVPVPAEHEADLVRLLIQMQVREVLSDWSEAEVRQLLDGLAVDETRLVTLIAESIESGKAVTDRDLARALDSDPTSLLGAAQRIAEACGAMSKPALVMVDPGPDAVGVGDESVIRKLSIVPRVAAIVRTVVGSEPGASSS